MSVGLVLGGGGITGSAFQFASLFALRMATGWDPDDADVIVGTSAGAFVTALVRGGALDLETLVGDGSTRAEISGRLRDRIYPKSALNGMGRWLRNGLAPSLRRPNLGVVLGSPARFHTHGIADWVTEALGEDAAGGWPAKPTVIVGYDLGTRRRVAFGTDPAPDASLRDAVAASAAVPFIYQPVEIDGRLYADGGVASGTSADFVLGNPEPLDLILVIAPMAADDKRPGARFYEGMFDRVGRQALTAELELVSERWPDAEKLVLRPDPHVLDVMRPNPLAIDAAVPTFLRTLRSMRELLARPDVWSILQRWLTAGARQQA